MIDRQLFEKADTMLGKYPIITITGPRQSGKTTFVKQLRPNYQYVSLEEPDICGVYFIESVEQESTTFFLSFPEYLVEKDFITTTQNHSQAYFANAEL
jgi:predicted AAA+ superfamily ATPase